MIVADQLEDRGGDILRLQREIVGKHRFHPVRPPIAAGRVEDWCRDQARDHRRHSNLVTFRQGSAGSGKGKDRRFRHRIKIVPETRMKRCRRRGVHDHTAPTCHMTNGKLRADNHSGDVDSYDALDAIDRRIWKQIGPRHDPGVVEDNVDMPLPAGRFERSGEVLMLGDIDQMNARAGAGLRDQCGGFPSTRFHDIEDVDMPCTGNGETKGGCTADPAPATGDEGTASGQIHRQSFSRVLRCLSFAANVKAEFEGRGDRRLTGLGFPAFRGQQFILIPLERKFVAPFTTLVSTGAPLPIANVNTDDIFPANRMKSLTTNGFGKYLFESMRYTSEGCERADFVLNQAPFRNSGILIAYANFGCGSSREHAVWALVDHGISCVIAPSFAGIFSENAVKNGLLLVELPAEECERLVDEAWNNAGKPMEIDLKNISIRSPTGRLIGFAIDPVHRRLLLEGLDDIERTLRHEDEISAFENKRSLPLTTS